MLFLWVMIAGLIGLVLMALPGMQRHGHVGTTPHIAPPTHGGLHLGHGAGAHVGHGAAATGGHGGAPQTPVLGARHAAGPGAAPVVGGRTTTGSSQTLAPGAKAGSDASQDAGAAVGFRVARLIPSPRAIFSILALFGAFGYALVEAVHLPALIAGLIALVPAWGIEYFAVRPLWNLLFQFQGKPTTPLEALVLCEARAVTPFRNGRGLVSLEHDGRVVQFSARLPEAQAGMPVRVGDSLCVEEVDVANQRVIVSVK